MDEVTAFLADKKPHLISYVNWGRQHLDFDVASYFSDALPPATWVTSVRGIVIHRDKIVVLENEDTRHYLPGGRLDSGESYEDCLIREVKEECGLDVTSYNLLGFLHFQHRQPKPVNYPYPYPHMFQLVYRIMASGELVQEDVDGYEFATYALDPHEAMALPNTEMATPYLQHTINNLASINRSVT